MKAAKTADQQSRAEQKAIFSVCFDFVLVFYTFFGFARLFGIFFIIKSKQTELFPRFYTNFKIITGRKGKKVIVPKFGHYYFFQVYFHADFFHVFYLNSMILKNSNDFCHSYAGFILAAPLGML